MDCVQDTYSNVAALIDDSVYNMEAGLEEDLEKMVLDLTKVDKRVTTIVAGVRSLSMAFKVRGERITSQGEGMYLIFIHGRSRMTIDPRILTMPGRSMSGFHRPGRHYLHQARSAVKCSASRLSRGGGGGARRIHAGPHAVHTQGRA